MMMAAAVMSMSAFTGCDDDSTAGVTFVEDFPVFTDANGAALDGSEVYLELGEKYDPAYTATLGGEDYTAKTSMVIKDVTGNVVDAVNTGLPGLYNIYYSGATAHGLTTWTVHRTVFVYNPAVTSSIAGSFSADMQNSFRNYNGEVKTTFAAEAEDKGFGSNTTVTIKELCPGFFSISDLLAGWYDQLRGYNVEYPGQSVASAYVSLNEDNTLTLLSCSSIPLFGLPAPTVFDGKYDPETGSLSWQVIVDNMLFKVVTK